MAPKTEEISDKDILVNNEDFRESWLEYHEDRIFDQRKELFNENCSYCEKKFPSSLKCFCHERFCQDGRTKRYTCKDCGFNFKKNKDLMNHRNRHKNPGGYFCFSCDAEFTSATARIQHRMIEHREFQCQICFIKYGSPTDYVNHIQTTHSAPKLEDLLEVTLLEETKNNVAEEAPFSLFTHIVVKEEKEDDEMHSNLDTKEEIMDFDHFQHDDDTVIESRNITKNEKVISSKKYPCEDCGKIIRNSNIKRHKKLHCNKSPRKFKRKFKCNICHKSFVSEEVLKEHQKTCRAICAYCNRASSNKKNFTRHMKIRHLKMCLVKCCPKCNKKLRTAADAVQHEVSECGKYLRYSCEICNKHFGLESQLRYHKTVKHSTKSFSCDMCDKVFKANHRLKVHVQKMHMKKYDTLNCHLCPGTYQSEGLFLKHLMVVHGVEMERPSGTHKCTYCRNRYPTKEQLRKHIKRSHTINNKIKVKCTDCKEYFDDKATMHEHRITQHKDKYVCHICSKTFKNNASIPHHMKAKHSDEKVTYKMEYLCGKCGKAFRSRTAHQDHERTNCGQTFIYQCDVCHKNLATQGSLKTHKLTHTDIRAFPCSYCEKSFRTASNKQSHERSHTGERPFKCTYCPKSFGHIRTLSTHLTVHTGQKRYMCTGCDQRFACLSNLRVHRQSNARTCGLVPNNTKPLSVKDERLRIKDAPISDVDE